jgi:Flp pilus assembly protein CpaB
MSRLLRLLIALLIVVLLAAVAAFFLLPGDEEPTPQPDVVQTEDGSQDEVVETGPTNTPFPTPDMTTVYIAVQDIRRGQEIPAEAFALAPWPREALPFNAVDPEQFEIEDLAGSIARTDIQVEQPILLSYLAPSRAELAATGSDVATIIPEGKVAISIPIDRLTSVSYAVQPGDRVDIAVALLFVDIDEEFQTRLPNFMHVLLIAPDPENGNITFERSQQLDGRLETEQLQVTNLQQSIRQPFSLEIEPREEQRPRMVVQRTVLDANVLFLGDFPPDGIIFASEPTSTPAPIVQVQATVEGQETTGDGTTTTTTGSAAVSVILRPETVTVAVTPQEALVLIWLIEARVPLNFFLRSAADNSRVLTDPVTLDYIMETYTIPVPARRDFSIEPAIRNIRQLITGDLVPITESGVSIDTKVQQPAPTAEGEAQATTGQ